MASISNFWQRIITGSLFLTVMIGAIVLSFPSFVFLFGVVMFIATHEYIKLTSLFTSPNKWLLYIANTLFYVLIGFYLLYKIPSDYDGTFLRLIKHFLGQRLFVFLVLLVPVIIFVAEIFRKKEKPFENIAYTILGFIYIAVPFVLLVQAFAPVIGDYSFYKVLAYFLILWAADSFAYVWGKLLGKHKLVPQISAGKTIEGTIGGIVTAMGLSLLGPTVFPQINFNYTEWVIFAALISIFAVPSDLSESLLKRQAGVKDSGKILPGHGGILDRFDSVLLTAPVIYIYIQITNHI